MAPWCISAPAPPPLHWHPCWVSESTGLSPSPRTCPLSSWEEASCGLAGLASTADPPSPRTATARSPLQQPTSRPLRRWPLGFNGMHFAGIKSCSRLMRGPSYFSTEVMWVTVERILDGAPTSIGAMSGAVAGLVTRQASTPLQRNRPKSKHYYLFGRMYEFLLGITR